MVTAASVHFSAVGYARVPALLSGSQVEQVRDIALSVGAAVDPRVRRTAERTRIDQVVSLDSAFLEVASSDPVLDALEPFLGPNIELVENRHNHLSMYHGPGTDRLHRDILQWSRSILTLLVYLSDCTDAASATQVVPGSHLWPCIGEPNNGGTWMEEGVYAGLCDQAVSVPARAGDAVVMHGQLYHAGGGASVAGSRIVLTFAFRAVDELAPDPPPRCRLVRGQRIYRGRGGTRA